MTEQEWLESADPAAMLRFVTENPDHQNINCCRSPRKLRLFVCACVRQVWHLLTDKRSRQAIEVAERFADGEATRQELIDSRGRSREVPCANPPCLACMATECLNADPFLSAVSADWFTNHVPAEKQGYIFRDIVGNPFRPVTIDPAYRTDQTMNLALAAYEVRPPDGRLDPDRLAVLSDALEEAGCPAMTNCPACDGSRTVRANYGNGDYMVEPCKRCLSGKGNIGVYATGVVPNPLLAHLRSPGPHWRGCWAVDLLLGKE